MCVCVCVYSLSMTRVHEGQLSAWSQSWPDLLAFNGGTHPLTHPQRWARVFIEASLICARENQHTHTYSISLSWYWLNSALYGTRPNRGGEKEEEEEEEKDCVATKFPKWRKPTCLPWKSSIWNFFYFINPVSNTNSQHCEEIWNCFNPKAGHKSFFFINLITYQLTFASCYP